MENAYIFESTLSFVYCVMGVRLLRLASRSGRYPERLLGGIFMAMGVAYVFWELPYLARQEAWEAPSVFTARIVWGVSISGIAAFTRRVFRPDAAWAVWIVWGAPALISMGLLVSAISGDWTGYRLTIDSGFWLEWLGQNIPFAWMACEALAEYRSAKRRVRIGLTDPLVANRYLLWSLFGTTNIIVNIATIFMYAEYANIGKFSHFMDLLLGTLSMCSVFLIFLAFSPPAIYRRLIGGTVGTAAQEA